MDRAGGLEPLDVPDGRIVPGIVLPPGEPHAARAADAGRARDAAAARHAIGRAVEPDEVTHARVLDLLEHAWALEELREIVRAERRHRRLEPRIHLVLELSRGVHVDAAGAAGEILRDALHELVLGLVRRVVL